MAFSTKLVWLAAERSREDLLPPSDQRGSSVGKRLRKSLLSPHPITGHSESLVGVKHRFEFVQPSVYAKP